MQKLFIDGLGEVRPENPDFFRMPEAKQAEIVDELIKSAKAAGLYSPPAGSKELNSVQTAPASESDLANVVGPVAGNGFPNALRPVTDQGPVADLAAENRANVVKSGKNVVHGVINLASALYNDPTGTASKVVQAAGDLGKGVLQKAGVLSGKDAIPVADAAGQALKDRYGSWEAINKTAHEDPVGLLLDLSTVLGGSSLALRAGGASGAANVVGGVASAVDPIATAGRAAATIASPAVSLAGKVGSEALGLTTGAGSEAVKTAYRAGKEGGGAGAAFREGLSGDNVAQVVNEARGAVTQLRAQRGAEYRQKMAELSNPGQLGVENTILDFGKIDDAVNKVSQIKNFKGQDISPTTRAVRDEMVSAIDNWKILPPADFHTVEGLDALKQKLGDIAGDLISSKPGSPASKVAGDLYNSVKQTIVDQAPEYAKIMRGYEEASKLLKEIESTLSLKPNANIDTSLRKLQSVLRNNVSTNYGRRAELLDFLQAAGAPNLLEKLAGQSLSSIAPRGLSRLLAGGEGIGLAGSMLAGNVPAALAATGGLAAASPRLVGNAAYGLGAASRFGSQLPGRLIGNTAAQFSRGFNSSFGQ